ncbi:EamA family transporter [Halobacteriovorax sp. GB3]|uniref:EamA family transporter n=1 Tax=Halobacteriovorax sp. GB3 TaxID=2719615 RepID=UPI00236110B8|nr:EamA family transporter [Halobacteriovorax sp. GB3]MDD0853224.1 EamA family transporter [Halobacteriovorax sp. GB3]
MIKLWICSFLWAFSFTLIGKYLSGAVDNYIAILSRFILAFVLFIPFTKFKGVNRKIMLKLMGIGSVQVGLMYLFFYQSFTYLKVYEVILFTIFTPLYISLIGNALDKKFILKNVLGALIAVIGSFIIRYKGIDSNFLLGFFLVQGANISFAIGQVVYRKLSLSSSMKGIDQMSVFSYFYLGAIVFVTPLCFLFSDFTKIPTSSSQWLALLWLGLGASGIGYYLWNKGASEVSHGVLAVMNNMVIPLGIVLNFLWTKNMNFNPSFIVGTGLIFLSLYVVKSNRFFAD